MSFILETNWLYKSIEYLEKAAIKLGVKGEVINESWFDKMKNKAMNTGMRTATLHLLFGKTSEIRYRDCAYLAIKLYGFFIAMNLLRTGLGSLYNRVTFNRRMARIRNRDVQQMFFANMEQESWAVISGCTSGIGLELARILNENEFNLVMISRDQEKLENVKRILESEMDLRENKIVLVQADFASIGDEELYKRLDEALEENGIDSIDLLFNNVGMGPFGMFYDA